MEAGAICVYPDRSAGPTSGGSETNITNIAAVSARTKLKQSMNAFQFILTAFLPGTAHLIIDNKREFCIHNAISLLLQLLHMLKIDPLNALPGKFDPIARVQTGGFLKAIG